jgi:hypothetical protein
VLLEGVVVTEEEVGAEVEVEVEETVDEGVSLDKSDDRALLKLSDEAVTLALSVMLPTAIMLDPELQEIEHDRRRRGRQYGHLS